MTQIATFYVTGVAARVHYIAASLVIHWDFKLLSHSRSTRAAAVVQGPQLNINEP